MKTWAYLAYDVILLPGEAVLVPAMSAMSDELDIPPRPVPPKPKPQPLIGKHVSLHGAYQVMVDNTLGEFIT
jgi:hypothetical protein